MAKENALK